MHDETSSQQSSEKDPGPHAKHPSSYHGLVAATFKAAHAIEFGQHTSSHNKTNNFNPSAHVEILYTLILVHRTPTT